MDRSTGTCLLCSRTFPEGSLEEILEVTREILNVLLIKVNTDGSSPVICLYCSDKVKVLFEFKSACFYTNDFINPFVDELKSEQVSLEEVFVRERRHEGLIDVLRNRNLCRLCLSLTGVGCISLDRRDLHAHFIHSRINRCLPEVDVTDTKNAVICAACVTSLENYADFLDSCASLEKKIKQPSCDINEAFTGTEIDYRIKTEEIENKSVDIAKYFNKDTSTNNTLVHKDPCSEINWFKCDLCSYKSKRNYNLKVHMTVHRKPSEIEWFKCDLCNAKMKQEYLKRHMLVHKDPFDHLEWRCDLCNFKAKEKDGLKTHIMSVHKDPLETDSFKCGLCDFKATYTSNLKTHISLVHKDPSSTKYMHSLTRRDKDSLEAEPLMCDKCDYGTRRKNDLKIHKLTHKLSSEINWFKCSLCNFKCKRKYSLKVHMTIHKDPSEIEWLKCKYCDHKVKLKRSLRMHVQSAHKDTLGVGWLTCDSCDFKTKLETSLKEHKSTHSSQVKWFRCDLCSYKSKRSFCLKNHMVVHKDPSEVEWFNCGFCDFKTRLKGYLRRHELVHKDP